MSQLTDQEIRDTMLQYEFSPDGNQCEAIQAYMSLLLRWNEKISLTTVVDPLEILRFHFGESIFCASAVPIEKGRLADVGSGAGFPGAALAIALPDLSVALIESNSKKAAFLSELVRELKLRNVEVIRQRFARMSENQGQFDYVTARALGNYESLLAWSHGRLAVTGKIVLWLGEAECSKISADSSYSWRDPIQISNSKRRYILAGSPRR